MVDLGRTLLGKAAALSILTLLTTACSGGGSGGGGGNGNDPPNGPYAVATSTGFAVANRFSWSAAVGTRILAPVSELESSADLNRDGDLLDRVAMLYDAIKQTQVNVGLAIVGPILANDSHFVIQVLESAQGADLNGDGDTADSVWHIYDPFVQVGQGNPFNTRVASTPLGLTGAALDRGFVLLESEAAAGWDRNGDGDSGDLIAVALDASTFNLTFFTAFAQAPGSPLVTRDNRALVLADESQAGSDLNTDGDLLDRVLYAIDFTQSIPILNAVGGVVPRAVQNRPYALTDTSALYFVDEASDGNLDLNNDGDVLDGIAAFYDLTGGGGEVRPIATQFPSVGLAGDAGIGWATDGRYILFTVNEADQAFRDLNGDMDWFDATLAWVDPANPFIANLLPYAVAQKPMAAGSGRAMFAVSETGMGAVVGVDLNGDFDSSDDVAFVLDMQSTPSSVTNLRLACVTVEQDGLDALVAVTEAGQAATDFNGDGDLDDVLRFYFDMGESPPAQLPLGIAPTTLACFRYAEDELRIAAVMPEGQSFNYSDINEDGDETDHVLVLFGVDPSGNPPKTRPETPFVAEVANLRTDPPLILANRGFAWPGLEEMAGIDLNGDGDLFDTVLQVVVYSLPE
jgi:hypothetical protein